MAPHETVLVEAPPSYPGGYGTIEVREVHHHHHHVLRTRRHCSSACCRAFLFLLAMLLLTASFSVIALIACNFYNLSECEKDRMPWEKPCKNWLGEGGKNWLGEGGKNY